MVDRGDVLAAQADTRSCVVAHGFIRCVRIGLFEFAGRRGVRTADETVAFADAEARREDALVRGGDRDYLRIGQQPRLDCLVFGLVGQVQKLGEFTSRIKFSAALVEALEANDPNC